ncbi:hypothetical protein GXM_00187 [Nostoc sphaeroides CCNUC1]|uniref:Uncharacterized protein n=1 Tax=Nostoc sphaeroides CCNUC1 TaxID=2653204 RepID=A0A5P8VR05_9NOSO|nr:hypothetical protein GXM_00187 [Nostoc sphaeroides CCNUC1]
MTIPGSSRHRIWGVGRDAINRFCTREWGDVVRLRSPTGR